MWTQENKRSLSDSEPHTRAPWGGHSLWVVSSSEFWSRLPTHIPFVPSASLSARSAPQPVLALGKKKKKKKAGSSGTVHSPRPGGQALTLLRATQELNCDEQVKDFPGPDLSTVHAMAKFRSQQTFSEKGQSKFLRSCRRKGPYGSDSHEMNEIGSGCFHETSLTKTGCSWKCFPDRGRVRLLHRTPILQKEKLKLRKIRSLG